MSREDGLVYFVHIITNAHRTVLYTGMTGDLRRRLWEHQHQVSRGFAAEHNVSALVHFERFPDPLTAIAREKQLKSWSRARRERLVEMGNPGWQDLAAEVDG